MSLGKSYTWKGEAITSMSNYELMDAFEELANSHIALEKLYTELQHRVDQAIEPYEDDGSF